MVHTSTQEQTQFSPPDTAFQPHLPQRPATNILSHNHWQVAGILIDLSHPSPAERGHFSIRKPTLQRSLVYLSQAATTNGPQANSPTSAAYQPSSILSSSQLRLHPNAKVANMTYCDTLCDKFLLRITSPFGMLGPGESISSLNSPVPS